MGAMIGSLLPRRLLAIPAWLALLFTASSTFSQKAGAEEHSAFYKWECYEAQNGELLDLQVLAFTTRSLDPLEKFKSKSAS